MELIQNLLNLVIPPITVVFLCLILPFFFVFKFIHFILRHIFPEKMRGKVVLITGASSGIGENLAYEYAKKGAYLVLVARREESLRKVAEKAGQLGSPDVLVVPADVSRVDQCKKFIDEAVNHFGRLDHLVCNAGIGSYCAFEDIPDVTNFVPVMDINFWGSIYPTYYAIPHLKRCKGKIIVNASVAGWMTAPRGTVYGASKAALIHFYDNLRIEVGPEISIVVISPGFVESEITQGKQLTKRGKVEQDQGIKIVLRGIGIPFESAGDCAKAIVTGACRGDRYITEPWLYNMLYLLRVLCPELVEWTSRLVYRSLRSPS
ncbi:11-beta-hydroxysteroid dehydrogenase A-like [Telopea speciosissima]|uniref:11-beta-hydroxysteroid dehydrogenase A-like n=1 Tax=Telopea speciosissima TaxID=54955 RepID=UPI001CC7A4C8|nr:11-beta-hydroxysteroid dehydrogenase A-like [Telopea speciosissima]XP_043694992.1 11-beta-hydroxysteroid dehydrogenase A-like [Telopea speciosissima]